MLIVACSVGCATNKAKVPEVVTAALGPSHDMIHVPFVGCFHNLAAQLADAYIAVKYLSFSGFPIHAIQKQV